MLLLLIAVAILWNSFYLGALLFTVQRIWIVLGRCLFYLRSVHTFSWFLKSNWSSDFGHPEAGSGAKERVVLRREFFCSKFKVGWENGVWTTILFRASGFLFTCGNFTLIFSVFSIFWIGFFLNGFPNPFIVLSWSSFLFSQWKFFELYAMTCPAMFFFIIWLHFDYVFRFTQVTMFTFDFWLTSLTVSSEWFLNPFTQWMAQDSEQRRQKCKIKRDVINR